MIRSAGKSKAVHASRRRNPGAAPGEGAIAGAVASLDRVERMGGTGEYILTVVLMDGWTWRRLANLVERHVTGDDRPSRLARLLLAEALAARA